ncbi:hypothetical protein Poly41_56720 [Novipirellula artificiosorum]|uniref:Uncharacterized protein n=1 Tax=Novipirellula artificiosorum TaxID=2528016 RepID=A0A5C6D907_9BACT|nr:hypothetical protein Poly41_56720 [Novipirellula artificiosorum]
MHAASHRCGNTESNRVAVRNAALHRRWMAGLNCVVEMTLVTPYANGVSFRSPGSRRGEAAERTLGYRTRPIANPEGVLQMTPSMPHRNVLWLGCLCRTPTAYGHVDRDRNPGCGAARRPWAMESNRFAVTNTSSYRCGNTESNRFAVTNTSSYRCGNTESNRVAVMHAASHRCGNTEFNRVAVRSVALHRRWTAGLNCVAEMTLVTPYANGVSFRSPGSRRGEAAERTLGLPTHNTPNPEGVLPMKEP